MGDHDSYSDKLKGQSLGTEGIETLNPEPVRQAQGEH